MARPTIEGSDARDPGSPAARERLPKKDYFLLPLVAASTLLAAGLAAEGAARVFWPEQEADSCTLPDGTAARFRANCVARVKMAESPWVTYAYNDCGYRTAESCRRPDLKVAVLGSSISRGYYVPYEQSFAARATRYFDRACRQPVSFQNLSLPKSRGPDGPAWHTEDDRIGEAAALAPAAALFVVAPYDLEQYTAMPRALGGPPAAKEPPLTTRQQISSWVQSAKGNSRALYMAEHFLYENVDRYLSLSLMHGDEVDFLRPPFTPAWRQRLVIADKVLGRAADDLRARGVPMVVVFVPNRLQASIAARGPGHREDAYALPAAIGQIVEKHGARFVDMTPEFARLRDPHKLFYPTDGHPTGEGHALIARTVERALAGAAPALGQCQAVAEQDQAQPRG